MRPLLALISLSFVPLGCVPSETVTAADVVVLATCPLGYPCDAIADGRSVVTVQACVPEGAGDLEADLKAAFRLSDGQWEGTATSGGELELDIGLDRCARPSFKTPTRLGPIRIDATIAGVTATALVPLTPAPIASLEIVPQPTAFAVGTGNRLGVTARSSRGAPPTDGTEIRFAVSASSPPGGAFVFPEVAMVDASGAAATSVLVLTGTTSVTFTVTVTPPPALDGTASTPLVQDVTVRVGS